MAISGKQKARTCKYERRIKKKFKNAEGRLENLTFFYRKGVENWKRMENEEEASAPPPKAEETLRETLEYASENKLFWFFWFEDGESFEG